jgi:hypothetical protein
MVVRCMTQGQRSTDGGSAVLDDQREATMSWTVLDGDPGSGSARRRNTWAQASARKLRSGMELWDETETARMVDEGGGAWAARCHMA